MKVTEHIPDSLAKVVYWLLSESNVLQAILKTGWKHSGGLERTWVPVGRIEIPYFYFCMG